MPSRILPYKYIGKVFGRWTVIAYAGVSPDHHWRCICTCGTRRVVRGANLVLGKSKSCGCLERELTASRNTRHGHARRGFKTPEYWSWTGMIQRCKSSAHSAFRNYGGRGIRACKRWCGSNGFANFLADMGNRPPNLTLDRRNNGGNYTPQNCRWATRREQRANQRRAAA
jgi:hypothetical protein